MAQDSLWKRTVGVDLGDKDVIYAEVAADRRRGQGTRAANSPTRPDSWADRDWNRCGWNCRDADPPFDAGVGRDRRAD